VDVSDLAAADVPHPGGLPFERVVGVLRLFLASPKCAGLVVTEFNPRRYPDGSMASRLASGLAEALGAGRGSWASAAR
jgi:arginase